MFAGAGELYANNDNGRSERRYRGAVRQRVRRGDLHLLPRPGGRRPGRQRRREPQGTDNLFKLADATEPAAMTIFTSAGISSVIQVLSGGLIPGFAAADLGIGRLPSPGGVTAGAPLWLAGPARRGDRRHLGLHPVPGLGPDPVRLGQRHRLRADQRDAVDLAPLADTYTNDPRFRVPYDQLVTGETNEATAGPVLGPARQVRGVVATALQDVLSNGADPQEALSSAAEEADALLADYAQRGRGRAAATRRRGGDGRGIEAPASGAAPPGGPRAWRPCRRGRARPPIRGRRGEGAVGDDPGRVARPPGRQLLVDLHPSTRPTAARTSAPTRRSRCRCCRPAPRPALLEPSGSEHGRRRGRRRGCSRECTSRRASGSRRR